MSCEDGRSLEYKAWRAHLSAPQSQPPRCWNSGSFGIPYFFLQTHAASRQSTRPVPRYGHYQ
jgi:hypothetical protein